MRTPAFVLVLLFLLATSARGEDRLWVGGTSANAWSAPANWDPASIPGASDSARFTPATANSCTLLVSASPAAVSFESGYTGTLTVAGSGLLTCGDLRVTSGTLLSFAANRVRVSNSLVVEGGNTLDVSCSGAATLTGGNIGQLTMSGETSTLTGTPIDQSTLEGFLSGTGGASPAIVGSLSIASGSTRISQLVTPATLTVAAPATLRIGPLSGLATSSHSITGTLTTESGGAVFFATGANIAGTLNASALFSLVACNGDWSMPGHYLRGGGTLLLLQSSGGTINHGTNDAGTVIVNGAAGAESVWNSGNVVATLNVSTSTTLRLATGNTLTIENTLGNLGLIIEEAGAVLNMAATLRATGPLGLDISELPAGQGFNLQLTDGDENLNGAAIESTSGLTIVNPRNGDSLAVMLTETGPATGVFTAGPIPTSHGSGAADDGALQVLPGDTLELRYIDEEDPSDGQAMVTLLITGPTAAPEDGWVAW